MSERAILIPAQRVMTLRKGLTRPFTDYRSGEPFSVREFSERLHFLVQSEFSKGNELFPVSNRGGEATYAESVRRAPETVPQAFCVGNQAQNTSR